MKSGVMLTIGVAIMLAASQAANAQSAIEDAQKLIAAQRYDSAIAILDRHVAANPSAADAYLLLAHAHHWKKDVKKAKLYYQQAAKLDATHTLEIIPLLDELGEWNEIIQIAAPAVRKDRKLAPPILGSLASAYQNTDKPTDAERIMNILATTEYKDQSSEDYKNYVLAYYHLWNDDTAKARERLKKIKDKAYLKYARTHDKFKKLQNDAEFQKLTE